MSAAADTARLCSGTLGLRGDPGTIRSVHVEPVHCVGPKESRFLYGGVGAALCIEALHADLGKEVSNIAVQFVRPTPVGTDLEVEVVRHSGRAFTQAAVECRVGDRLMMAALASLGSVPGGLATAGPPPPPAMPAPLDCPVIVPHNDAHEDAHRRMELRHIQGKFGMFSRHEQSRDGHVRIWMRPTSEPLHVTHLAMVADFVPSVTGDALGYRAGGSSLDNVFRYLGPLDTEWVLADLSIRRINRRVAHSTVDIWDQSGRLIAMGGQSHVARSMLPAARDG
jgi:acyl-CoA thioesterase